MSRPRRQMKFSAFIAAAGHHPAAWRRPDWQSGTTTDLSYWIDVARTAERGKLDAVFLADGVGFPPMKPGVTERVPLLTVRGAAPALRGVGRKAPSNRGTRPGSSYVPRAYPGTPAENGCLGSPGFPNGCLGSP